MNEKNPSTLSACGNVVSGGLQRLECDIATSAQSACNHIFEAVPHGCDLVGQCAKCGFRPNVTDGTSQPAAEPVKHVHQGPLDANRLEQMARERPDDCFLKGSGILKLTGAIRYLEGEIVKLGGHIEPSAGVSSGIEDPQQPPPPPSFQQRVRPWMQTCFGEAISNDLVERNHRFLEEALELVQATGCTQSEAHQLVDYVFGRPVGERNQEVGGVMVTLAALCLAAELDMHHAAEVELARVWTKVDSIRAKQAAKPKHSPLPQHVAALPASRSCAAAANIHQVQLKSRKEMNRTIPRDRLGWWYDVCPGQRMTLRDATASDLARCSLKNRSDNKPEHYLCELPENGALIHRDAIKQCRTFSITAIGASDMDVAAPTWPAGLLDRVKAAEQRIIDGHSLRRIPADPTDVDMVLAEMRDLIEGKWPPCWLKFTPDGNLHAEVVRLNQIVNSPQSGDFLRAVSTEGEHQRQRWGSTHDAGKSAADWFWLVGHLAGKALHAHAAGNLAKAEHHVITTAAALLNWHMEMFGKTNMRPGIDGAQHNVHTEGNAA